MNRDRARQQLMESFWKIAVASVLLGVLFALTAAGGGFGGSSGGNIPDGSKAVAVIAFTLALATVTAIGSYIRYILKRKPIEPNSSSPKSE